MEVAVLFTLLMFMLAADPYEKAVEIRRFLHQHPELSNRETKTHAYLKSQLEAAGFDRVETFARTGLRVVYDTGRPGPVIGFRGDIDALPITEATGLPFASNNPGVMHACGHDLHTGILFGTALQIRQDPNLTGSFVFYFQPSEEGPPPGEEGGAALMIADGALDNPKPDVIFALHTLGSMPTGAIGVRAGGIMARADRFHLKIEGKQAHGSAPHQGIDPIYVGSQVVSAVQSIVSRRTDSRDPVVISFGSFKSGNRFNIIPATAELSGTIRTLRLETGDRIPQLMDTVIAGVTAAHGAAYVFENETMCPSTQNDPEWTNRATQALTTGGFQVNTVDPKMIAEDFAYFAERTPGVYFFLGVCAEGDCADIHTPEYSPDESAIQIGVRMFSRLASSFAGVSQP